jgi:hypothetical protein
MNSDAREFREGIANKLARYWVHVLALLADLAAIVAVAAAFLRNEGQSLVALYIVALLSVLWILLVIQEYRYARKAAYSEAGRYIHSVLHFVRDTDSELPSMSESYLTKNLERILDDVRKAFRL